MTTAQLVLGVVIWLGLTLGAAWVGARFLPDEWYHQLAKPAWTPPGFVFTCVWTALYLMMALAAWLVWQRHGLAGAPLPLGLFLLQLLLNAAWTWLFFGLHRPGAALLEIVVLWIAILATLISFWRLEWLAGVLLLPYLAWVLFAVVLNWVIWAMNRQTP